MLTLILPHDVVARLERALTAAGSREVGGILMAEHAGVDEFIVRDLTVHRRGAIASFVRRVEDAVRGLSRFFSRTLHDYRRFNYIGEWHSHPSFEVTRSERDHQTMVEIVSDASVGANFVVLVILKLSEEGTLIGNAWGYLPDGRSWDAMLLQESSGGRHVMMVSEHSEAIERIGPE